MNLDNTIFEQFNNLSIEQNSSKLKNVFIISGLPRPLVEPYNCRGRSVRVHPYQRH